MRRQRQQVDPTTGHVTCERCGKWYKPDDRYWALTYCEECDEEIELEIEERRLRNASRGTD